MSTTFLKVKDNGQSTLYTTITTAAQTTFQIQPSHTTRFPTSGSFLVRVYNTSDPATATQSELMMITSVSSNQFTVTRNYDALGAISSFASGNAVRLNVMAKHFDDVTTAINSLETGWATTSESWTRIASYAVTVPGDKTSKYGVGDWVRLTDTTTKYFQIYVMTYSAGTLLTTIYLLAGTDHILNSSPTNIFYSKIMSPAGAPTDGFNGIITFKAATTNPTIGNGVLITKARLEGKYVKFFICMTYGSTSTGGSGQYYFDMFFGGKNTSSESFQACANGVSVDTGLQTYRFYGQIQSNLSAMYIFRTSDGSSLNPTAPFTFSTGDTITLTGYYLTNL